MKRRSGFLLRLKRTLALAGFIWFGLSVLWPTMRGLPESRPGGGSEGHGAEDRGAEGRQGSGTEGRDG